MIDKDLKIALLTEEHYRDYEEFLQNCKGAMFTHSIKYKTILEKTLKDVSDHYICVYENKQIVAVLPLFLRYGSKGIVANSLPFYGSHGGLLFKDTLNKKILNLVKSEISKLIDRKDFLAMTLIGNPSETIAVNENLFNANYFDQRISQITYFPTVEGRDDLDEKLLKVIHSKTRNMVRKGLSQNFKIRHSSSVEVLKSLYDIHCDNMLALSGKPKPLSFFDNLSKIFEYDLDYRVYYAEQNNEIIAALLLFYFKDTVEYFTPVISHNWRDKQPLSAIIYEAMKDAIVDKKMRRWNWGGTWISQKGVYRFKSRWGARDSTYNYQIISNCGLNSISKQERDKLLSDYNYFYVEPLSV